MAGEKAGLIDQEPASRAAFASAVILIRLINNSWTISLRFASI
jgi:hypothetical protein